MLPTLIEKYAAPVPRYTSYPTAPHFNGDVTADTYASWLAALPGTEHVSLYLHIPFCDTLCWYCGCSTKATRQYEPVADYVDVVLAEIRLVAAAIGRKAPVAHIHWGGGSPNVLKAADIRRLGMALRDAFDVVAGAEFAVEIDPRHVSETQVDAFADIGMTRVSLGVQDFDETVQKAINRIQSFATTRDVIGLFRSRGISSVNIDLVYGLPHQSRDSVERTIRQVVELSPDRIALFGYAHLPSRFSHQRLIPEAALPGPVERFAQANRLASILTSSSYERIGLDHFAKRTDDLATRELHRNFQGYTTDEAATLIGLGATSIGQLPQGYVQNAVPVADYKRRILSGALATARGRGLTEEDRMRAFVIERLMCDLSFSAEGLKARFGEAADGVIEEAEMLVEADYDGLVEQTPDGFVVTERGRPFIRTICSCFDSYLAESTARHSAGV